MKKFLCLAACALLGWSTANAEDWTDKTSLITNPSFETDDAVSDATKNALNSATVTGWTVLPTTTVSNAQAAVVNSSSTLSVLSGSDGATTGSKYFYIRQNWNATGNFGISQTITRDGDNLPAGLYMLTSKIKTSSSDPNDTKWTLSIQEGDGEAKTNTNAGSAAEWLNWGVVIYKESAETNLTISAYMVAGKDGGGKHYAMLLDDFELKYISSADMSTLTADNTLDLSGIIYNAGIYNSTNTVMPRGWIAYASTRGNNKFTEGTGDTRLEGWSGSNMNIDYYQPLANLPVGKYTITANAQDSNDKGAKVYGWCSEGSAEADMTNSETTLTTPAFKVTNGSVNIGIKHNGGASWVTGDNFKITYLGIKPLYDDALSAATTARDNNDYAGVLGKEKADLLAAIALTPSSYTDYQTAITALETARETFIAAKDTYAECVSQYTTYTNLSGTAEYNSFISSSTTGQDVLNAIKTAQYPVMIAKYDTDGSALFIPEWTVTNFDAQNAQHWSGQTKTYYDKWSGSGFECSISRTATLPQGHYVFYAAGRGQANSASAVTLKVNYGETELTQSYTMKGDTGYGIATDGTANFSAEGTYANNNAGRGWEWRYITFDLDAETDVTLSIVGAGNNSWVSACDTKLLTYENIAVSQALYNTNKTAAIAARDNSDYTNVKGTERTALVNAINAVVEETYAGYRDAAVALENATNTFIAAKTNYDLLVAEITKATALGASTSEAQTVADASTTTAATALTATQDLKVVEYNYVTTTYKYGVSLSETWTTTGDATADNSGQHWDGTSSTYKEQKNNNGTPKQGYDADSWTIGFSQNVALPAGNYVFKVAGRKANSENCTLSLEVKNGETTLGTVSDFPKGDTGKGIDTSGATNFGDGTYANNNNGRGWEWRYVKFTLAEAATVTVAVNASATASHQWISFCNYTVQTDVEANTKIIAYNVALNQAQTTINNVTYKYVGGTDRSNLQAAIDADESLNKSDAAAIVEATNTLNSACEAFTAGVASWNAYVLAKNTSYADDQPYASAEKYAAIATAKGGDAPNTASEAATKTSAILSAYRKYVESNALAEGVTGAEQITIQDPNMDVTYDGTNHTFGAWQVISQTNGSIQLLTEQSFTDGDGNSNYKYADIWKKDNNAGIQQTVNLPIGRYLLTVTARAQNTDGATFRLFAGAKTTDISRINAIGGVFDRGWNDVSLVFDVTETSDVNIGVQSGNGKDMWWSATRFRLVKIADVVLIDENADYTPAAAEKQVVVLNRNIKAENTWNTFVVPFAISNTELKAAFGDDVAVAEYSDGGTADAVIVNFNTMAEPAITANVPVLLKVSSAKTSVTFTNRTIVEGTPTKAGTYFDFVGSYAASTTIADGDYYLSANKIYKSTGLGSTIAGTRAYIKAKAVGARIANFFIDDVETTAINGVELKKAEKNGAIYNLNGQKMDNKNLRKGLYIINGRKVVK